MDEYISKHEAYLLLKDLEAAYIYPPVKEAYATAARRIDQMKAADVQPVKRGRWIISNIYAQCSECSVAYDLDTFQRLIPMNENVPRHCSYCGADMRGGAENDT